MSEATHVQFSPSGRLVAHRGWSADDDEKLRALWDEGLSTAQIGLRMNRSKNSVIGRAGRLDLPARPSPILPRGSGAQPRNRAPRAGRVTLTLFRWCVQCHGALGPDQDKFCTTNCETIHGLAALARKTPEAPRPVPVVEEPVTFKPLPSRPCCFPMNDGRHNGKREWLFCNEPSAPGKPYCSEHCRIAYQRRADAQEAA